MPTASFDPAIPCPRQGLVTLFQLSSEVITHLLLLLLILLPALYPALKLGLFGLLWAMFVLAAILERGRIRLHPWICGGLLAAGTIGLVWSWVGQWNGGQGLLESLQVHVLAPVLYLPMMLVISRIGPLYRVTATLILATLLSSSIAISQLLSIFGTAPPFLAALVALYPDQAFTSEGTFEPRVLSSLVFTVPFVTLAFLFMERKRQHLVRPLVLVTLLLGTASSLLGARNAFLFILLMIPAIVLAGSWALHRSIRTRPVFRFASLAGFLVLCLGLFLIWQSDNFRWTFSEDFTALTAEFSPEESEGARIRSEQIDHLTKTAVDNFFLGRGLGTEAPGLTRNDQMPWRYELRFLAFWYQLGTPGFLALSLLFVMYFLAVTVVVIRRGVRAAFLIPFAGGLFCALMAEATNPYLTSIGLLWMVYLPVGALNAAFLLEGQQLEPEDASTLPSR